MLSPNDLPGDILDEIFAYFEYDKAALCNLALRCRRFRSLTPRWIFRHLGDAPLLKYDLLECSLNVHPVVLLLVRSGLNIHLEGGLLADHNARDLRRCPNLHQLSVSRPLRFPSDYHPRTRSHATPIERRGEDKLQCPFVNEFLPANITTVSLFGDFIVTDIARFMFLGRIRSLTTSMWRNCTN